MRNRVRAENLVGRKFPVSTMVPAARGSLPREREQRRDRRHHSATEYAILVGETICETLRKPITEMGRALQKALSTTLKREGFKGLRVRVLGEEVHAYIGGRNDPFHGHVIVPISTMTMRYCRGYGMPHGYWNCI